MKYLVDYSVKYPVDHLMNHPMATPVLLAYMFFMLPGVLSSVGSALEGAASWIDKMATGCLVIVILLLVLGILWILSLFSRARGGARG